MENTQNLGLKMYDQDEPFNITGTHDSLNANMDLIDKAFANQEGIINSLSNRVADTEQTITDIATNGSKTKGKLTIKTPGNSNIIFDGANNTTVDLSNIQTGGSSTVASYTAGNAIEIEGNKISVKPVDVTSTTAQDNDVPSIGSIRKAVDDIKKDLEEASEYKLEGFSSSYYITKKGWHRVLHTIRGNGGILSATMSYRNFYTYSFKLDLQGVVEYPGTISLDPTFYQSEVQTLGPSASRSDSALFEPKVTKVRIGYPSQTALDTKFDPAVGAGNPINCYVDVYVDFDSVVDPTTEKDVIAFTSQFTGKAIQHNCYNITEETTDDNYVIKSSTDSLKIGTKTSLNNGLYGEELSFCTIPLRENIENIADNKSMVRKAVLADDVLTGKEIVRDLDKIGNLGQIPGHITVDIPDNFDDKLLFNVHWYRKYNILNLNTYSTTTDRFYSTAYNGKRLIRPFDVADNVVSGVKYNFTNSGAIIFKGTCTTTSSGGVAAFNVFAAHYQTNKDEAKHLKDPNSCIILPAGRYMTNVQRLYLDGAVDNITSIDDITQDNPFPVTTFTVDKPTRLSFAILLLKKDINYSGKSVAPFLVNIAQDDAVNCITYTHSYVGDITTRTITKESGSSEIVDLTNRDDSIIIYDKRTKETIEIKDWNDFYSDRRINNKQYTYQEYIKYVDFNEGRVYESDDKYDEENSFVNDFNMVAGSSLGNYYDTILITQEDNSDKDANRYNAESALLKGSVYSKKYTKLPSVGSNSNIVISRAQPANLQEGSVWVKPLAQEIVPPVDFVTEEATDSKVSRRTWFRKSTELWYSSTFKDMNYVDGAYTDVIDTALTNLFFTGTAAVYTTAGITENYPVQVQLTDNKLCIKAFGKAISSEDSFINVYIKGILA